MNKDAGTLPLSTKSRALGVLLSMMSLVPTTIFAQWADPAKNAYEEAITAFQGGNLTAAIKKQKSLIETLNFEERPADAWQAIETLYVMCQSPGMSGFTMALDVECTQWAMPYLEKLPIVAGNLQITALRKLYFLSLIAVYGGQEEYLRQLFDQNFLEGAEQYVDNIYYVNRQLLASEAHIRLKQYADARTAVERALGSILAVKNGQHHYWQVSRWLLAVTNIYLELNDIRMAQGIFAAASPLIFTSFAPDSPDMLAANSIAAAIFFKAGIPVLALQYSNELIRIVDKLNEVDPRHEYLRDYAMSVRLGSCLIIGDQVCIESIGNDDIQNSRISSAFNKPKESISSSLLEFITVRAITLLLIGHPISEADRQKTIELIDDQLPKASDSPYVNLLRFGRGMMLFQNGELEEASDLFASVAEGTVGAFRRDSREMIGHVAIPQTDQWIMWMMILTMGAGGEYEANQIDLIVAMASGLQRSSLNVEGDFLSLIANSGTEQERQVAHSYLRTTSRQRSAYVSLVSQLVEKISADARNNVGLASQPLSIDYSIRMYVSDYGQRRNRLLRQIEIRNAGISALPLVSEIQEVMEDDEVLLLQNTFGGTHVTVCVRSDDVQLVGFEVADMQQSLLDVKLIRLAMGGGHAPSLELDRQFPVHSATRLFDIALRPIHDCLRDGDTVYVSGRSGSFPWEVLLEEMPEELDGGYDFSSAKWAMKRFNFAYIGTTLEFVSGKIIDRAASRSSGLFGIGDPILDGKTSDGVSKRLLVQRGMIGGNAMGLSGMAELPDTSIELRNIQALFGADSQVLTRQNATESDLRRSRLEGFEYLSFATHGLMREELPGLQEAALVLTPVDSTLSMNDGLLTASEIADFRLNARVAFLSACNTSSIDTDLLKSEVQSFSAAFATAGVPATVATLSYVDSMSARLIAEGTFKYLIQENASVAQALTRAKIDFVENPPSPEYSHPRFWAPIVSIGNSLPRKSSVKPPLIEIDGQETISSRGGEVRKIITDSSGSNLYARYLGDPVHRDDQDGREELQSWVAKIDAKGKTEWKWTRLGSGSSSALLSIGQTIIVPGAGVAKIKDGVVLQGFVELNALDKETGELKWSKPVRTNSSSAWPADVVLTSSGHILLLIVEWDPDSSATDFTLIKFSPNGEEVHRKTFRNIVDRLDLAGNVSIVEDSGYIHIIYRASVRYDDFKPGWDDYHNVTSCHRRIHAKVRRLDPTSLDMIDENVYPDREYKNVITRSAGGLLLIGREYADCGVRGKLIVSELKDSQLRDVYRDQLSDDSSGNAILELKSGDYLVLGSDSNQLDSRLFAGVEQYLANSEEFSFDTERYVAETAMDGLVILLSPTFDEKAREWVEGGADSSIVTGVENSGGAILGGINGSKGVLTFIRLAKD